jgi:curved DNA-binding protein CbpA
LGQEKEKCNKIIMNKRQIIASILNDLNKLDQQGQYKIADLIFNNLRLAQEVEPKNYFQLLEELEEYSSSTEALKAGYKTLSIKYHPDTNNNDPIATENFKQLQMAYKRLLSEINKTKTMSAWDQSLLAKPMTPDKAKISWDGIRSFESDQMYLSPEQVSQIIVDDYKFSIRRKLKDNNPKTQEEINNTPPVKAPSSEYDIDDILESLMNFAENLLSFGYDMKIPNREGATQKTPHVMNVELTEKQAEPLIIIPEIKTLTVILYYYDEKGNYTNLASTRFEPQPNQISERKQKLLK